MTHITAALMSFRLFALMPHHLPRLIGFSAANRVDTEAFYQQAGHGPPGDRSPAALKQRYRKGCTKFWRGACEAIARAGLRWLYFWA